MKRSNINSTLRGFSTMFNIFGKPNRSSSSEKNDMEALKRDWYAIGDDFKVAINQFNSVYGRK